MKTSGTSGKVRSNFVLFVLALLYVCAVASAAPWQGSGTAEDPYLIADANDMQAIGADPNYWDAHFKLTANIDLSQYDGKDGRPSFNLIGGDFTWSGGSYKGTGFSGTFDGNGHEVSNFHYDGPISSCVGLFRSLKGEGAAIRNLGLRNPNVLGASKVGALVGMIAYGATISDCYVEGADVRATSGGIGGLIGFAWSDCEVIRSHFAGRVFGNMTVGGLVGRSNTGTDVSQCSVRGQVSAGRSQDGVSELGGLVGYNRDSRLKRCLCLADVSGTGAMVGGLVGQHYQKSALYPPAIQQCYIIGDVSGTSLVGGIVGYSYEAAFSDCYIIGNVSGTDEVGGIIGRNWRGQFFHCYVAGKIFGTRNVHGIVGERCYDCCYSFFDKEKAGLDSCLALGRTTLQMQTKSTFTGAGWDFTTPIWKICQGTNYPKLSWQIPIGDFLCPDGVDMIDLGFLAEHWLDNNCDEGTECERVDLNGDGIIDFGDFAVFAKNWLTES